MRSRRLSLFVLLSAFSVACATPPAPPPEAPKPATAAKPPAPKGCLRPPPEVKGKAGPIDEGTFTILVGGKPAGEEWFSVGRHPKGGHQELRWKTKLDLGPMHIAADGALVTDAAGRPRSGEGKASGAGADARWVFSLARGGAADLCVEQKGQPPRDQVAAGPVDMFLPSTSIAPAGQLCALAGAEPRTVLAFPGMEVKLQPIASRPVTGPDGIARELAHVVADVASTVRVELLCEGDKLLALRQAISGTTAVRKGQEHLAAVLETADRSKPPTPAGVVELPRKVKSTDGVELACTLAVPASHADVKKRSKRGKTRALPAVVFGTGSGAQDRDEDTVGPGGLKLSIFKTIAMELAKSGIASLRCDDRGTGASTGEFAKATLDSFVADADAALVALRAEPAVDPARTGFIGHSEGGVVGPMVAAKDPKLGALVVMAGPGRGLDAVILEQTENGLRRAGADETTITRELAEAREVYAAIKDGKPLPARLTGVERAAAEAAAPWLHSHFVHDVPGTAEKVTRAAVMIAQGAKDAQVAVKDAELLRDALARGKNKRVTYKVYPDLNHLFAATQTGSMADYSDPEAKVDATFLTDVVAFLKKSL